MAEVIGSGTTKGRLSQRLLIEPRRPMRIRNSPRAAWLAVAAVCVGAFMGQLDASIVTVAIPQMAADLRAGLAAVEWVSLAYLVVLVGTVTAVGRWSDMVGRKLLYCYGFVLFTLASLGCGLAGSLTVLIVMRVLQAIGAAMLQANSVALIRTSVPAGSLPRAIGLQATAQALGLAVGPAAGGLLIDVASWRWVFWVNLPAGVIGVALAVLLLPRTRERAPRARFDWPGLSALIVASAAVLVALSALTGRPVPWLVVTLLGVAVAAGWLFIRRQRRAEAALVDLTLFGDRTFRHGIVAALLGYLVMFGLLFVVALYEHHERLLTAGQSGAALTALPVALGLAAPQAARLSRRVGTSRVAAGSMVAVAMSCGLLILSGRTVAGLVAGLALAGAGLGLFTASNNAVIAGAGARHQAGMVGGLLNMTRGLGTALGVSVASAAYGAVAPRDGLAVSAATLGALAVVAAALSMQPGRRQPRPSAAVG